MADKVRRVDWSPAEWLSGVVGVLTMDEVAVYITVLNLIYDRGGECPYDERFIAGLFKAEGTHRQSATSQAKRVMSALGQLVKLGKLGVLRDSKGQRWLTNGRATSELGKARGRITSAARAGVASGQARRARKVDGRSTEGQRNLNRSSSSARSNENNDLDRTVVRNHQPSTIKEGREISNGAARATVSATDGPAARAPDSGPRKMGDVVAEIARKRRRTGTP